MSGKTRIAGAPSKSGMSPADWDRLMRQAITRAERMGDPRLLALKTAVAQGKTVVVLKRMGIIGENDLQREFPIP